MSAWRLPIIAVQRSCFEDAPVSLEQTPIFKKILTIKRAEYGQATLDPLIARQAAKRFGRMSAVMAKGRMKTRRIRFAPAGFASAVG